MMTAEFAFWTALSVLGGNSEAFRQTPNIEASFHRKGFCTTCTLLTTKAPRAWQQVAAHQICCRPHQKL